MKFVIKRNGRSESFSEKKLYISIFKSCQSVGCSKSEAAKITAACLISINNWMQNKTEVTTNDIRHSAAKILAELNHDAGYLYKHNRIMD